MSLPRRILRLVVIGLLAAVLLIPDLATVSAANTTRVSIVSGKIVTGGANITIRYDCFPNGYGPYNAFGDVRVGQVSGVTGESFFNPKCNDKLHTQAVFVAGNFVKGDAAVSTFICGFDCNSASKEIRLR
jgi:hypothetical protein